MGEVYLARRGLGSSALDFTPGHRAAHHCHQERHRARRHLDREPRIRPGRLGGRDAGGGRGLRPPTRPSSASFSTTPGTRSPPRVRGRQGQDSSTRCPEPPALGDLFAIMRARRRDPATAARPAWPSAAPLPGWEEAPLPPARPAAPPSSSATRPTGAPTSSGSPCLTSMPSSSGSSPARARPWRASPGASSTSSSWAPGRM
jgi:hypothetical protein